LIRLAVAASARFPNLRPDWLLLRAALADRGVEATTQVWTDPAVSWDSFDLVVANGAWDNIHRPDEFLAWAGKVAAQTRLVNSAATLRWNLDKRYLADLADAGVPIVPTTWVGPGQPDRPDQPVDLPEGEFVIKPTISGGGFETARYLPDEHDSARQHITRLLDAGRTVMVQPYQAAVDTHGELGLIFLAGRYSHTIGKGPMLRHGAGGQPGLWEHEVITTAESTEGHLDVARRALRLGERLHGPTTYARVDLVPLADGTPGVLELELLDPALFFEMEPAAAERFAQVLVSRIAEG
jgi:hypothetical protein